MRKRFWSIFIALALSVVLAVPAWAVFRDMSATVYKWTGNYNQDGSPGLSKVTSGLSYIVLSASSDTEETLYVYGSKALTSKTNPVTSTVYGTDKMVKFRVDPTHGSDTKVDLIITDTSGAYTTVVKDFDQHTRTIVIDERPNVMHHGIVKYSCSTTDETSTGVSFGYDTFVHDVRLEVIKTLTGGTIHVGLLSSGTGGDADGFLKSRSAATAGFVADTGVVTAGASTDYVAASTYGALLYTAITGTGATWTTKESAGGRSYLGHVVTGSNTGLLTYTCSTTTNSGAGYIHYFFTRMR